MKDPNATAKTIGPARSESPATEACHRMMGRLWRDIYNYSRLWLWKGWGLSAFSAWCGLDWSRAPPAVVAHPQTRLCVPRSLRTREEADCLVWTSARCMESPESRSWPGLQHRTDHQAVHSQTAGTLAAAIAIVSNLLSSVGNFTWPELFQSVWL